MGTVVAIGALEQIRGYGLAGVRVVAAPDAEAVRCAWSELEPTVSLVILTADAACALSGDPPSGLPLVAVMPR
ncbi:hypothetical protein ACW9HQ_43340 [Nocardia gipuzkoensis]